ncbi:hypothetical protein L207DRAFT_190078 [Hyaloscypha variabilis F]|uniref:Uncharacterized protein n=1 Tax=Hyaloscypha variabilis (strain UAMH 11265 / GT02V1 / F) TaxID=1149755 RepID=A0A2J6QZC8_HYAVF|nr:hypothetical protein L207DRAFT_190078 [Hyaloscypha variabilis F]
MARGILSRVFRRSSRKEKTIPGYRLDIEIAPLGAFGDAPLWRRVDTAVQIPSNDRNLISLSFAKERGLVKFDDNGNIVDNIIRLQWRRRDLGGPVRLPYECKAEFAIQADLQCEVIFGKHDPHSMLPEYPSPFAGATKENFGQDYGFSKQRTNSWAKTTMIVRNSFSWGSDKSKAKSTKSSSDLKMSPMPRAANNFDHHKPDRPELADNISGSQDVQAGMASSNATYNPPHSATRVGAEFMTEDRNMRSAVETRTKLATIPSNESAELREAVMSSDDRTPKFCGDDLDPRPATTSQKDDSRVALASSFGGSNIAPTNTLAISKTSEIASLKLPEIDRALQQTHLLQSEDNGRSFEPSSSLPRSTSIPRALVPLAPEDEEDGKRGAANDPSAYLNNLPGDCDQTQLLYPVKSARTPKNTGKEASAISNPLRHEGTWASSESNDSGVAFRQHDVRQNSLQSIDMTPIKLPRPANVQFIGRGNQEMNDFQSRTDGLSELRQEKKPTPDTAPGPVELSASQEARNLLVGDESQPLKLSKPLLTELEKRAAGETQTDAVYPTTQNSIRPLAAEQSTISLAKSLSLHDPSVATERPIQGGISTPIGDTNILSGGNMEEAQSTASEVKQHSERSSRSPKSRSKQRTKKRGKAPKIRSWKGDLSQKVDLTPAPGADKYWNYHDELDAYYHIDSDTGSTLWYEDSSDEPEE